MKHPLPTVVVVALIPFVMQAQGKPDFSGTWTMDPSRSESALQGEPIGPVTLVVSQTANELKMETTRAQQTTTTIYKLDGSENKIKSGTARTHWEGTALVTEAELDINGQTVTTKESRTLDASGNEMLVDMVLVVQHGYSLKGTQNYGTGKNVYIRRRQ